MVIRKGIVVTSVVTLWMGWATMLAAQDANFSNWPAGTSPQEVGKKVAEHFVTSPHQYTPTLH
jgi:unsaturated rhamnogalacturonyl hydrolase